MLCVSVLGVVDPVLEENGTPSFVGETVIFSFLVIASLIVRKPTILGLALEKNVNLLLDGLELLFAESLRIAWLIELSKD